MSKVEVEIVIERPPAEVWAGIEDVATHVEWMHDAAEIRFLTVGQRGIGTRFECDTVVGPIKLTDVMEITEWDPEEAMGVRHVGYVTGTGVFTLEPHGDDATLFKWSETLEFPWFFGGKLGARIGQPILRAIWRKNLKNLKANIEAS